MQLALNKHIYRINLKNDTTFITSMIKQTKLKNNFDKPIQIVLAHNS